MALPPRSFRSAFVASAIVAFLAPSAAAQSAKATPSSQERAAAEALDVEGTALLQEQRFAEACPKLAESARRAPGTGVLMRLGLCQERVGALASAWIAYEAAAARAQAQGDTHVLPLATKRAAALEPRVARLVVRLDPASRELPSVQVYKDDEPMAPSELGVAFPIDPGLHVLRAAAPGHETVTQPVTIPAEGGQRETVLTLRPATVALASPAPPSATASSHAQQTWALVAGGAGLLGLGIGTALTVDVRSKNSAADALCNPEGTACSPEAIALQDSARPLAAGATVAFVAGGAAIVGGLALWLSAPKGTSTSARATTLVPTVGLGTAGFTLRGAF